VTGTPRRVSSPVTSPSTTPRPSATQRANLSPATATPTTSSFTKSDPLKLRRSLAGLSPTRQPILSHSPEKSPERLPERSPERSPDKSFLLTSPDKFQLSADSPPKRSPPSFRQRLLSSTDSPERQRRDVLSDPRAVAATKEVEELTAKLRILETKRIEDRRRIREYEASKEAETNFGKHKEKLQAKLSSMQEEIRNLKTLLKETETQLTALQSSAAENAEVLEMATLDREMAEERCEVLQLELDSLKERQEEMVAENEYLKSENEEFIRGAGVGEGGERTAGSLQLERQNERLKEALVRLRDITGKREGELKSEITALTEEIDQLNAIKGTPLRPFFRVGELTVDRFDEVTKQLTQQEALIEDLKQQLDTALSAEDLLEELTERNLSLTERIDEMRTTIEDLESLRELNDELEENHLAQERELREEVEFKDSLIREQTKRIQTAEETNLDYESTIMRFRELVLSLQRYVTKMFGG
jgi:dynactin 1